MFGALLGVECVGKSCAGSAVWGGLVLGQLLGVCWVCVLTFVWLGRAVGATLHGV